MGQQTLDTTEVEQRVARVGLLDHAGDDVAFSACVLFVLELTLGLANSLRHHLASGLSGDPTQVVGGGVELFADRFTVFVEFLRDYAELHGVGVDGDPRVFVGVGHLLVGGLQRVGESSKERVDGNPPLDGQRLKRLQHLVVHQDVASL